VFAPDTASEGFSEFTPGVLEMFTGKEKVLPPSAERLKLISRVLGLLN
jgi:hypothetical protein